MYAKSFAPTPHLASPSLRPTSQTPLRSETAHGSAPRWLQGSTDRCPALTSVLLPCLCATPRLDLDSLARANMFCANSLLFSPSLSPLLSSPPRSHSTSMQRAHCANATSLSSFLSVAPHGTLLFGWVRIGGMLTLHTPAFASRVDLSRDKPCACGARISTCARARARAPQRLPPTSPHNC